MSKDDKQKEQAGGILPTIIAFFSFLGLLWQSVPKEKQEQIMSTIADGFDAALRAFFRFFKKQEEQTRNASNEQKLQEPKQDAQFS